MSRFALNDSVGRQGVNNPHDVRVLKVRLIDLGFDWLTPNDQVDADLEGVINLVQSIRSGRNELRGDGVVDVPGPTYDWLRAINAPRWLLMPAGGGAAQGFDNFELTDTSDHHDFGTSWLAATLEAAGAYYRDNHLAQHAGDAVITVNDASLPHGGHTPDHAGHETGLACDLRLPRTDGSAPGNTTHHSAVYDRDAARAMLQAFHRQPQVGRIFFNDPVLIQEKLCTRATGHDDHYHIEVVPLRPLVGYDDSYEATFDRAIRFFNRTVVSSAAFPVTLGGFQDYLDAAGIQHFSAREMLTPNHATDAHDLGFDVFLPPQTWWPRGAALAALADDLRTLVGEPVHMRNWWRPERYNARVGGADDSDHVTAHGVDLDYGSVDSRRTAEARLREWYADEDWLELSLGVGNLTTHVGMLSPGRRREWRYASYVP